MKVMEITKELVKIFASWTKLKIRIHASEKEIHFHEREMWWVSLGQNIGVESNGKNTNFERPMIILKRFNKSSFLGVVVSSIKNEGKYYLKIKDDSERSNFVNISQVKLMSSKRLLRKVRKLSKSDFELIKNSIKNYI